MADFLTPLQRSKVMARVTAFGNCSTELVMRRLFRLNAVSGWRRHWKVTLGAHAKRIGTAAVRPDFVFRRKRLAVFIDGCFWHRCPKHCSAPVQNSKFWRHKFERNVRRDRKVSRLLRRNGWSVVRIWEHDLRERPQVCVRRVQRALESHH